MLSCDLKSYRIVNGAPCSMSFFALAARAVRSRNIETAVFLVKDFFYKQNEGYSHPCDESIVTYVRGGFLSGMWNVVYFSDSSFENCWVLIQSTSFVDILVVEGVVYFVAKNPTSSVLSAIEKILNKVRGEIQLKPSVKSVGCGIGQTRPFHYFYDQFKYIPLVLPLGKEIYSNGNAVFYDPSVLGYPLIRSSPENFALFYPCVITQNWINAKGVGGSDVAQKNKNIDCNLDVSLVRGRVKSCMEYMERRVRDESYSLHVSSPVDVLTIWVGITSSKRSWVEQVEGYSKIINSLYREYGELKVYVDGLTSPIDNDVDSFSDVLVYEKIKNLSSEGVDFSSLIGLGYKEKIGFCQEVSVFICNGGTGGLVPLRICNKPGVIHTNSRLMTFPDDYSDDVKVLVGEDVGGEGAPDSLSYSLSWERVLESIKGLINYR